MSIEESYKELENRGSLAGGEEAVRPPKKVLDTQIDASEHNDNAKEKYKYLHLDLICTIVPSLTMANL